MLRIEGLTYRIGPRTLFENADAAINEGHRVGFVGRNGAGKTTLLNMITGAIVADTGIIDYPQRWRIGITKQEAPDGEQNLIETVLASDRELAKLNREAETATDPNRIAEIHTRLHEKEAHRANSRAARILAGLGFSENEMQQPCSSFSGGWRMRVALAGLLFTQPDLLLLDEPTNHLDLEACLWLEEYLRRYQGTILIVSHDRGLLNRVVNQILHLDNAQLKIYAGGYDRFETNFRAQLERIAAERARQEAQRAHIQKFVDRFRYKATKARQAQSRLKMLEKMEPLPERGEDDSVAFAFPDPKKLPPPLYSIDNASVGYDGKAVLNRVSFRLDMDDRIALIGANGNGKSTLIKLLAGRLEALSGHLVKSNKLRIGYFAQHQTDELDLGATPLIELSRKRPKDLDVKLRSHLGRFGFSQERAETRIGDLSGGEKARLLFAIMSCDDPHILLLDEPTNHLDVVAREALVQAINAFEGAVVIVSHDPHVIELTADRLWLVDSGTVTAFDGDLDDYRKLISTRDNNEKDDPKSATETNKKEKRRIAAEKRNQLAPLRKRAKRAEENVKKLTEESEKLQAALADPKLYEQGDNEAAKNLQMEAGYAAKNLADAEEFWLESQEELDAAEAAIADD
ncbi:MAG: glycosyl transferase family 1 [Rhodospirillaceae bacterium]|nr:glycosyl transferase family 1 [Rhodospirillaceae bacterium]|tara:strand:- start:3263 stop:5152 length:1890 start_codon:yes stop_codon:yes gene_type:complete